MLVAAGANVNAITIVIITTRIYKIKKGGETPIMKAATFAHKEVL